MMREQVLLAKGNCTCSISPLDWQVSIEQALDVATVPATMVSLLSCFKTDHRKIRYPKLLF